MSRLTRIVVLGLFGAALSTGTALAQSKQYQFVTNPVGSNIHGIAIAIAALVSKTTPHQIGVAPYGGAQAFVPILNGGDADFSLLNAQDVYDAFHGIAPNYRQKFQNLRLVSVGTTQLVGLLVKEDSAVRSGADVKGKRVTGAYSQHKTCEILSKALWANLGLTSKDFVSVPVTQPVPAINALAEGRSDVAACIAPGMAAVKELNARQPVRFVGIDPSPSALARAREVFPAGKAFQVKAGSADGIKEDLYLFGFDFYLITNRNADAKVVRDMLDSIWKHLPELRKNEPLFNSWEQARMADSGVTIPYHDAAVAYFRERGVWSAAMENHQQGLLAASK